MNIRRLAHNACAIAASATLSSGAIAQDFAPDARFGVATHFAQGWNPEWIPEIARASVPGVRDELYWGTIEARPGVFAFPAQYQSYMAALRKDNVAPLIVLDFANKGYDGGNTPYSPGGFAAYARYAAEVLRQYGDQVRAVEIWNEFNGSFCTGPAAQRRAADYLQLLRTAYTAIKSVRPDVTVVGGATSGIPIPYWTELLKGGALAYMDVLSVHPYRYDSTPEGLESEIAELRKLEEKVAGGTPKPIWVTEIGWETRAPRAPGELAIDDATVAKYLVRAYALLFSAHVERVYWYEFRDDQGLDMGLVRGDAHNTPKPAYFALANMIHQLSGARFVRRERTPDDIYSMLFVRPSGEQVRVIWALKPVTLAVRGAVSASNFVGTGVAVTSCMTFDDSPCFVTGPLTGLPPPPPEAVTLIADSRRDFSSRQGDGGWFYGTFAGANGAFSPLNRFATTDWKEEWTDVYPFISFTAGDQHPAAADGVAYPAVRRWVSDRAGQVRIAGSFQCGTQGDGVGASILVDGRRLFRELLGGGRPIRKNFDFLQAVKAGTTIDFVVDPGPAADVRFDATNVEAAIRSPGRTAGAAPAGQGGES